MLTTFLRSAGDYASNYWVSAPGLASDSGETFYGVGVLSNGDIVAAGYIDDFLYDSTCVVKVSRQGRPIFKKSVIGHFGKSIAIDGSDNIHIGSSEATGVGIQTGWRLDKWGADATSAAWLTSYTFDDTADFTLSQIAVDASGNVYGVGYTNDEGAGGRDILVAKFNSSGVLQWDRTLGNASYNQYGHAVAVDSSGNVYVAGYSTTAGAADGIVAKYNTSGTIQWQRKLSSSSFYGVGVDSSGNVYVSGGTAFIKYNSSGAIQFQKSLTGASFQKIHITSDDRIFVVGTASSRFLVVEYDTSGTLQWQNKLDGGYGAVGYGVAHDARGNGAVVICGYESRTANEDATIARLPDDGSLTGTYGAYTYSAAGLTAGTGSGTDAVGGMTDTAAVLTSVTGSGSLMSTATGSTEYRTVFRP